MNTIKALLFALMMLPMSVFAANGYVRIYGGPAYVVNHMGHTFYHHPRSGVIYAKHYNRHTIDAMVNYCQRRGIRNYHWIPRGYLGAIPYPLHNYAHQRFQRSYITVNPYRIERKQRYYRSHSYRYRPYHYRSYYYQPYYGHHYRQNHIGISSGGFSIQFRF